MPNPSDPSAQSRAVILAARNYIQSARDLVGHAEETAGGAAPPAVGKQRTRLSAGGIMPE